MDEKLVSEICKEVYKRFPETRGSRPKIQLYGADKNAASHPAPKFLLVFKSQGEKSSDQIVQYIIRVVVNSQGKILKMSMSR